MTGGLKKIIKGMWALLKTPSLINYILESDVLQKRSVTQKHSFDKGFPTVELNDLCNNIPITLNIFSNMGGGSTIGDYYLLCALAKKHEMASYFEIGTWRGESVANVAQYVNKCYTLNLSDEQLLALGHPAAYVSQHRTFSKNLPNVQHLFGDSKTFNFAPFKKKMDLVFVDGSHHPDYVENDTRMAFELINENGMIVWHDYLNEGLAIRWEVLNGILNGAPPHLKGNIFWATNTLCAIYVPGKMPDQLKDNFLLQSSAFFKLNVVLSKPEK